jgi:bifunctional aspartokinase / homoserine dehydrogenase 1
MAYGQLAAWAAGNLDRPGGLDTLGPPHPAMAKSASNPEVFKFGGASLSDAAAFKHAATIVRACEGPLVVVCSAPAGVTDLLLEVAEKARTGDGTGASAAIKVLRDKYAAILKSLAPPAKVGRELAELVETGLVELETLATGLTVLRELSPRTSDLVVSRGERMGTQIFAAALAAAGIKAEYVDALEVIATRGPFGNAAPDLEATDAKAKKRLGPLLAAGVIPVVPGFLGAFRPRGADANEPAALVTLGRGGTDLTATLVGRALSAKRVTLWKDVPGLLTADPRVVPDARIIPQLNVREAAELAYYGAKVLHPRALIPLAGKDIPLYVRPFATPSDAGTEISARHTLDEYPVKALSAISAQAMITVAGRGLIGVPGVAARTFATLSEHGMSVSLITQSSSEQSICFTVPEKEARAAKDHLERAFAAEIARREVDSIQVAPGMATVAVVGLGMAGTPGIAARVFSSLAAAKINLVAIAQGSSELNISFVVKATETAQAQRAIHQAFHLAKIGGGRATHDEVVDVVLLGFGQIGRTLAGLITKRNNGKSGKGKVNKPAIRIVALIDRSGFVFDPKGMKPRRLGELAAWKEKGEPFAKAQGGQVASGDEAVSFLARHALSRPVLIDVTADETTPLLLSALQAGMDLVLANKRPLSGPKGERDTLLAVAEAHGRRIRFEATVGAGLPVLDTYRKLVESGDKVLEIEGCVSGTLGFLFTELGRGRRFSDAVLTAMNKGFTEPDPRDDLSGADVGRKALILGRLLGFEGEPGDVAIETLVPEDARALGRSEYLTQLPNWDADWGRRVTAARAKGEVLRYVATVTRKKIRVGLQSVGSSSPFAELKGTDNQIAFTTSRYKSPLVIRGAGAGPAVTAGGVLNDLLELGS